MKPYGLNELREMFLAFFESKGHLRLPSFSLVPENDKSVLFTIAGMTPLKPWFKGEQDPPRKRIATCQKCIRTNDIDNVGVYARYNTYFEMLGNFSFGDYFKREAIAYCWEFLTVTLGMDTALLYPTVYEQDDEAFAIWRDEIGVAPERIYRFGKEDNFWEHGSGPCGPSSEVFFDRGEKYGCGSPDCAPGCDCDRYVEIWNNVFTQFDGDGAGNYTELSQKNIDTGMGLERLAVVCQGADSNFDVDTMVSITNRISELTGLSYGESRKNDVSLRIITDHIRASVMLISDGVLPSNEGRGYVLRRLLRRAARHGRLLGFAEPFLHSAVETVVQVNEGAYPEVRERAEHIARVVATEEDSFNRTLDSGLKILEGIIAEASGGNSGGKVISGADAFRLYDTFGFPIDLTIELANERGVTVDIDSFKEHMDAQRERARNARAAMGDLGWDGLDFGGDKTPTEFVGYETMSVRDAKIAAIIVDGELRGEITAGQDGIIVLDKTPFYAESGGQTADTGTIISKRDTSFRVTDVRKTAGGKFLHHGKLRYGKLQTGGTVGAIVGGRDGIKRAHTATHILHAALREELGEHVTQAGSLVERDKLRFDFTHFEAMTAEQIESIDNIVNRVIREGLTVTAREMSIDQARAEGAVALFGEKYGDTVRVVSIDNEFGDNFSKELCGGTHVGNTSEICMFRITSEFSVASGVRRIEAVTGLDAYLLARADRAKLADIAAALKATSTDDILPRIEQMNAELRELRRAAAITAAKTADNAADELLKLAREINGMRVVAAKVEAGGADVLRQIGDKLRDADKNVVAVLASVADDKITFLAVCGADAVKRGVKAGDIIKAVSKAAGGSGGGKPESAMGGGKDVSKLGAALDSVYGLVE